MAKPERPILAFSPTQVVEHVQTTLSNLTTARGLRTRASQNLMISGISQMLEDRAAMAAREEPPEKGAHLMAIEAPTGTGKSFGYLIPSIVAAKSQGVQVVVATAVVSLQEQLLSKDLPAVLKASPVPFTFALAKGRGRFVCTSKLKEEAEKEHELQQRKSEHKAASAKGKKKGAALFSVEEDTSTTLGQIEQAVHDGEMPADPYQTLERAYRQRTWDGEQESVNMFPEKVKAIIWPKIITDNSGCSGKSCKHYNDCPYMGARAKWMDADVIVANHDLVLSDLRIGSGGALLSPPHKTIYIFDEGHHLPGKARDAWTFQFRSDTNAKLFDDLVVHIDNTAGDWEKSSCTHAQTLGNELRTLHPKAHQFAARLNAAHKDFEKALHKLTAGTNPKEAFVVNYNDALEDQHPQLVLDASTYLADATTLHKMVADAQQSIIQTRNTLARGGSLPNSPLFDDSVMKKTMGSFGFYVSRLDNFINTLKLFLTPQPTDPKKPPIAKWVIPDEKKKVFSVHAGPTMATELLPAYLYSRAYAVVHASATLTSVGGFSLYKQKTGLQYYPNTRYLKLESPFDFEKNAVLSLGDLGVDPGDAVSHTRRLVEVLPHIFEEKNDLGTLVLFSSKSQLENVAQMLPPEWKNLCKVQYTLPNLELIESHKKDVDQGKRSILMGTQSFSEGLDLPGAWCSHVISTKLPFSMPDNPIDKTLADWMKSQGRNVFSEIAVPEAGERLIQQAGRLLRREEDQGQITILDNRLVSKWKVYGQSLVESLPPFRRTRWNLNQVKSAVPALGMLVPSALSTAPMKKPARGGLQRETPAKASLGSLPDYLESTVAPPEF